MKSKLLLCLLFTFAISIMKAQQNLLTQSVSEQEASKLKPLKVADVFDLNLNTRSSYVNGKTGLVYREEFQSENAGFIRLEIKNFDLKEGDYMEVYSPTTGDTYLYSEKGKIVGTKENPYMISDFWTPTIFSDHIIVSLHSKNNSKSGHYGFDITQVAYGYDLDTVNYMIEKGPDGNSTRTVCGSDDKERIACYDGTEMYRKAEAVCKLFIPGGYVCTGWLLGCEGNIMTNNHCIGDASTANNTDFVFNYRYANCSGSSDASSDMVATYSTFEYTSTGDDFTIVELPVNPTGTYGYLSLSSNVVSAGERIYIPQHPGGRRKEIAVVTDTDPGAGGYAQVASSSTTRVTYFCDTEGGSSGSPVLRYADNLVVAIHNTGSCSSGNGAAGRSDELISTLNAQGLMPNCGVDDPNSATPQVAFQSSSVSNIEGTDCSFVDYNISINLNQAASANTDVNFTVNGSGTAIEGTDFDLQTSSVTFPVGSTTSQTITVRVYSDALVEGDETAVIDLSVNANGGDATANPSLSTLTFTISDDDLPTAGGVPTVLLTEDFEADYSSTWATMDNDGDSNVWTPLTGVTYTGITGNFPGSESDGSALGNGGNFSPDNFLYHVTPFTVPANTDNVNFNFGIGGFQDGEPYEVYFTTSVSSASAILSGTLIDSGTTLSGNGVVRDINVTSISNQTGYFVVRHISPGTNSSGILLLDNITITATVFSNVQTSVNNGTTHDQLNLPGNGTVYTSDDASGNVMVDIVNNNAHDYGCIDVAVARSGTGGSSHDGSSAPLLALDKTFYINPTNTTGSGDVTITFYFTEAEVAGWEAATGGTYNRNQLYASRDDSGPITFAPGNTINAVETVPLTVGSYGTSGVTFTGTFTGVTGGFVLIPDALLSVDDNLNPTNVGLYPNPTNGIINITMPENTMPTNYKVYNMLGQEIINKAIQSENDLAIDARALQSGMYFVKISNKTSSVTLQFIRE